MLASFIAVDTETTGLDHEHDRIIELAAVRFENGLPAATFTALLSPGDRALSPVARLITGIRDDELDAAPPRAETLRAFLAFAGDSPLIAHNAGFDAHFVRRALAAEGLPDVAGVWIDSLLLSRIAWPTWDSHRLDSLAERLAIARDEEHRALPDARRAGHVFLAAQHHLRATLSPSGWLRLAALAADLPDWSLVFHNAGERGGEGAGEAMAAGVEEGMTSGPEDVREDDAERLKTYGPVIAQELAALAADEGWLGLETPVGLDDTELAVTAVLDHLTHAGSGQRILLAVPDTFAWNAVRKTLPARPDASGVKATALAEPSGYLSRARLASLLADPSRLPLEERAALLPLVAWADRHGDGPVADGRGFSPERARLTWSRVQCDTWNDDPAARAACDAAAASDLILVTHATLCAHVARDGALLPACDAVVVTGAHRYPEAVQSPAGAGRMISLFRLREILAWAGSPSSREDADAAPAGDTGRASAPPTPPTPPTESGAGKEDDAGLLPARAGAADPEDRSTADGLWKELAVALAAAPEAAAAAGLEETMLSARRAAWFDPDRELQKFLQKAGKQALKSSGNDFRVRYRESVASAWGADPGPVRDALRLHEDFLARALTVLDARPDAEALADTLRRMAARLHAFHADFAFLTDGAQADGIYWLEDGANPYKTTLRGVPCALEGFGDALRTLFGAGLFLSPVLLAGNHAVRDARPFLRLAGLQASPDSGIDAMPVRRLVAASGAAAGAATASLTVPTAPTFLMAPFAPTPRPGEEMQAYARFLLEATHPFHDRGVLIFCPSQTAVRALHGAFRAVLGAAGEAAADAPRVYAQWIDGNRDAITRLYAAGRGGFVIASEGLPGLRDDAGRAPAVWALTRMPLPPPRDPILEARGEPLREEGRNARGELWQPAAVLRVKREWSLQHRGPAPLPPPSSGTTSARAPEVIWLLDARAATEGLGTRLAEALGARAEVAGGAEELRGKTEAALGT